MSFSLFWAFAYLFFTGLFNRGDYLALIEGLPYRWIWRLMFVIIGLLLYRWSIRFLRLEFQRLRAVWRTPQQARPMLLAAYLAAGFIATAGAALDPRGSIEMFRSGALVSFGGAMGLLAIPARLRAMDFPAPGPGLLSNLNGRIGYGWIAAAILGGLLYIFVLGPGLRVTL